MTTMAAAYQTTIGEHIADVSTAKVTQFSTWAPKASAWIAGLPLGYQFTAEDLRDACGNPDANNAMGAVIRTARQRHLIFNRDGAFVSCARVKRHGAPMRVWERM